MFPGRDEDLLSKVFALTEAARGTVSQRTYKRLVPRDDLAESLAVARQGRRHQVRVVASRF